MFPKACSAVEGVDDEVVNSVLNRVLIDATTNKRLSNRNPSEYLGEVAEADGAIEGLRKLLRSHLLPEAQDSPLFKDDFWAFINQRQQLIAERVYAVTGWDPEQRKKGDEVVDAVRAELKRSGLTVWENTCLESGYKGLDLGGTEEEPLIWFGRYEGPRIRHSQEDWLWVSFEPDEPTQAAWASFMRKVGAPSDYDDEGARIAAVRLADPAAIAEALRFLLSAVDVALEA